MLAFNVDPIKVKQSEWGTRPMDIKDEVVQRLGKLMVLFKNHGEHGSFSQSLDRGLIPREVASFLVQIDWPNLPQELAVLAQSAPQAAPAAESVNEDQKPWLIVDPRDPEPEQPWYTPARYFARQLVIEDSSLLTKRDRLADKIVHSLTLVRIYKRGGKKPFESGTVKKALSNVSLG